MIRTLQAGLTLNGKSSVRPRVVRLIFCSHIGFCRHLNDEIRTSPYNALGSECKRLSLFGSHGQWAPSRGGFLLNFHLDTKGFLFAC